MTKEQKPVAWLQVDQIGERFLCFSEPTGGVVTPLYAAPQPHVTETNFGNIPDNRADEQYKKGFSDGMKEAVTGEYWVRVIDEAMVGAHLGVANMGDDYGTAKDKLNRLICWSIDVEKELAPNKTYSVITQQGEK